MQKLLLICALILSLCIISFEADAEEWVPFVPNADEVELQYWRENGISYINVTIEFRSTGFDVSDWGTPNLSGNIITVNAKIWMWTGVSLPVIIKVTYTYVLGDLISGEYTFIFNVWHFPVKSITFTMRALPEGPYYTEYGTEYWIVELNNHPARLISIF
jgi:hypothetical protein